MRLIKYYDNSIFELARKFMPARANTTFGIVIEPNIFERSKAVLHTSMSFDNLSFRGEIDLTQYAVENLFSASAEYKTYNGTIGPIMKLGVINLNNLIIGFVYFTNTRIKKKVESSL